MRSKKNKITQDFDGMKYSPELIRQLSDPEYAREEERYARQAQRRKNSRSNAYYDSDPQGVQTVGRRQKRKGKGSGSGKKKYRWRPGKLIRNLLILLLIVAIAGTGVFYSLTGSFDKIDTDRDGLAIDTQVADDLSGYRNIAILGVDARADEGYDGSRTDAIIILSIKKSNGEIRMISVMRDSYLKMDDGSGNLILDKITHAHAFGGGENTIQALNRSLDLNIEEFVIFNWKAVADAVDCLGGIEVDVKESEISDLNTWGPETGDNVGRPYTEITETGKQTLDGVQATTYCRIRKNSGGDAGRTQRYKKVMAAMMKKAISQPWKLSKLSDEVFPNIRTNMSQTEMYTAAIRAPFYNLGKNVSWPEDYYAGLLGDISYVVPITLETEVKKLHKEAFDQDNYTPSLTCQQINEEIMYSTGIY
ncbi:MAG: LCP family protein [Emergencia sp.]|nr:LCP family protein [Emergencia sp.]